MPHEIRPLPADEGCSAACLVGCGAPLLVGVLVLLALRGQALEPARRERVAAWSAALGCVWLAVGVAARIDPGFRDLFVLMGLLVNAYAFVEIFVRTAPGDGHPVASALAGTAAGVALLLVLRVWPTLTVTLGCLGGWSDEWADLLGGMRRATWLPWCSQSHFAVALTAMAISAGTSAALAAVAWRGADRTVRGPRARALLGLAGSLVVFAVYVVASLERCRSGLCS